MQAIAAMLNILVKVLRQERMQCSAIILQFQLPWLKIRQKLNHSPKFKSIFNQSGVNKYGAFCSDSDKLSPPFLI